MTVLEARDRVGGRVEQTELPDGRLVQLGGEVVGNSHTSYIELVGELGLTLVPSYVAEPGEITRQVPESVDVGEPPAWFGDTDVSSYEMVEAALEKVVAGIDPSDPFSCPDLHRLDQLSVGDFLRETGATPAVLRAMELVHLSLSDGSIERTSMFAYARKMAVGGGTGSYDVEQWENMRVAEGSATVALTMADQLTDVRLATPVSSIAVAASGCRVTTAEGEELRCDAVVLAVPAGPARDIEITGVSDERLASLRRQRHAWAAKFVAAYDRPFWRETGQNGLAESEGVIGSTWPQTDGVLSALVPPERYAAFVATDADTREREALAQIAAMYGDPALAPLQTWTRLWGTDPWTQGYVTNWRPGDVEAVGPLHGTHEAPFYVCGSDQWVAGYMEGAVRTGRDAARAAVEGGGVLMDFALTEEQRAIIATTRAFVEKELYPHEEEVERTGELDPELAQAITAKAIRAGLHAANMPEDVGGAGLDTVTWVLYEKELGKAGYALHSCVGRPSNILLGGNDAQKEKYLYPSIRGERRDCLALTEPGAGSDLRGMRTRAVPEERDGQQGWHIKGTKHFISHAADSDFVILFARTEDTGDGKAMSSFLVDLDTPGVVVHDGYRNVSHRGYTNSILDFDCWVPYDALLGEEGKGLDLAGTWLGSTRLQVAATCLGRAERALDLAVRHAAEREQFGQKIGRFQGVSFKLADMALELQAAELLTLWAAWKVDQGTASDSDIAMAKLKATEVLAMVADEAIQVHGGMGLMDELPLERIWRDARIERIWDGTSEIQRHIISRGLLRPLGS